MASDGARQARVIPPTPAEVTRPSPQEACRTQPLLSPPMRPVLRPSLLSILLFVLALSSCASTGASRPEGPAAVTYHQYSTGTRFTIVNESHTDRLAKYSTLGADASVKVATDEVMAELLKLDASVGLVTAAGEAPDEASPAVLASIQIEDPGGVRHALKQPGQDNGAFNQFQVNFLTLFNQIYAPQAVEADPSIFDGQTPRRRTTDF